MSFFFESLHVVFYFIIPIKSMLPDVDQMQTNHDSFCILLLRAAELIRSPRETVRQCEMVASQSPQNLYPMFDGLNSVSACPWSINKPVR
jgi:hypothetical protein